jgi:hypothetical protein
VKHSGLGIRSVSKQSRVVHHDTQQLLCEPHVGPLIPTQIQKSHERTFMQFRTVDFVASDEIEGHLFGDQT